MKMKNPQFKKFHNDSGKSKKHRSKLKKLSMAKAKTILTIKIVLMIFNSRYKINFIIPTNINK